MRDAATRRYQAEQARQLATCMVGEVELARYRDPFDALEFAVSYSYAFAAAACGPPSRQLAAASKRSQSRDDAEPEHEVGQPVRPTCSACR